MSFIQFESAREKEKLRQELREAREQLLEKAKINAEQRLEREKQQQLRGETNWMLPAVAAKFDKISENAKVSSRKSKKHKDKKKKVKKSKKSHKKRKHQSSSSEEDTDSESDSDNQHKQRSHKKSKRKRSRKRKDASSDSESSTESEHTSRSIKKKSKNNQASSSTNSASSSDNESDDEWVESQANASVQQKQPALQRDDWMTDTNALMLKTFSRERIEKRPNEKQQYESYDPAKSVRELNPYWKSTGTGLPAFQKPSLDSDDEHSGRARTKPSSSSSFKQTNAPSWRKQSATAINETTNQKRRRNTSPMKSSSSSTESENEQGNKIVKTTSESAISNFLTDQQMNELAAKILKAEIMGNTELAEKLKTKLENARVQRANVKERKTVDEIEVNKNAKQIKRKTAKDEEHILLTRTDERGNCRPLAQAKFVDPRDLYGGRNARKKQKRLDTHVDGERVRYFPDDDKYDIKQMFEREKYTNAADANLQFANIAGKHKNPNDDLDDIFADKIRTNTSKDNADEKELQRVINEQRRLETQLDNCDKCFDSLKMDKKLLVSMGEKVYLTLSSYTGLQTGHCIIVPTQHVSCATQLDEDTWEEVNNFRKALTRMFAAQHKDVIFYEIANRLQRRPHLSIHCIPIPASKGEMAPFYFKKAIEESEREWSVNKQLISLSKKSLRSSIPKGLPYFWVNFGMDSGFAHVIEDEDRFPANFAQEIIGGMLELSANKWRKPQKEQNIIAKVKMFAEWWKKFDCTTSN